MEQKRLNDYSIYNSLGWFYQQANRLPDAEKAYKQGLSIDPRSEPCRVNYGLMLARHNRQDEAKAQLSEVLPPAEVAYNLFEQGKYDQAQTIVEGLVISNPYDGYFHSLLGSIYGRKGMHEEAIKELQKTIGIAGRTSGALGLLGHAYAAAGQQPEALKILDELKERSKNTYVSPWD